MALGECLYGLGLNDDAQASFTGALRLNPTNAVALNNLGVLRVEAGDPAAAVGFFDESLS